MAVNFLPVLHDPAFQGQGELLDNGSVHLFAPDGGQSAPGELVRHFVAAGNAKEVGGLYVGNVRNAQGESTPLFDIF